MAENDPTQESIKRLFLYDADTGILTRIIPYRIKDRLSGQRPPAGCLQENGYRQLTCAGKHTLAHRMAWIFVHGEIVEGAQIDHINGNRDDNRICNLRLATGRQNQQNKLGDNGRLIGASFHTRSKRWRASIGVDRKVIYLGEYKTAEEAHAVYAAAKSQIHQFNPTVRKS